MNGRCFRLRRPWLALLIAGLAGPALALDLMGSYDQALRHDPSQRAADAALSAGREKAVQGDSLLRPQLALSASLTRAEDRSSASLPAPLGEALASDGSGTTRQAALQLTQPLYNAKDRAERRQLHQQTALAEISHRDAEQELLQRVGETYFGVLLAEEQLRVVRAEQAAVTLQRDRAQARFDVGRGRITDLQEAQARLDTVTAREVSVQSTLALRRAQYEELTGAPATGLAALAPGFRPVASQPDDLAAWQGKGLDANTRVRVRQSELAIAAAEIEKFRLASRPTLDLVARYTAQGQSGNLSPLSAPDGSRSTRVGLQLNVPLYTGGALNSKEREALAKQRQAEEQLAAARRDARLQVQDAWLAVRTGVSRIAALDQSTLSAQTALEATTLGRDLGTRTELDVLDAQQRLFNAQLDLAQARNDYLLGRLRLSAAAGELREDELRALNAYLVR